MKCLLSLGLTALAAVAMAQTEPNVRKPSLEELAVDFFSGIAMVDSRTGSKMWNSYGLSDAEAAEVLGVARRTAAAEAQQASLRETREHEELCEELHQASTADALLAALQNSDERSFAATKAAGTALLGQLSAGTRAHVLAVLAEERKSMQVSRIDWVKIRNTQPEALEMLRAKMCPN
jgi:hypothetical protein